MYSKDYKSHLESLGNTVGVSNQPYSAAGCLFVSDQHVLAGYQPHKRTAVISGFGGKREGGEEPLQTAWRETLEELLGIYSVPKELIEYGMNEEPIKSMSSNGYTQVVYTFTSLERVLKEVSINSPLYNQTPRSVSDLIFRRKQGDHLHTEVPVLCLLPLEGQIVANHFIKDILEATNRTQCHDCFPRLSAATGINFNEGPLFADE